MYLFNVLKNLVQFWTLNMPLSVVLPAVFLVSAILHGLMLWSTKSRIKWMIPILCAGLLVMGEVSIWLIRSYVALLIIAVMHFAMAALLGALFVTLLYKFWTKTRS